MERLYVHLTRARTPGPAHFSAARVADACCAWDKSKAQRAVMADVVADLQNVVCEAPCCRAIGAPAAYGRGANCVARMNVTLRT